MARKPVALVMGASGFVGRHLCPALAAAGYHVRCGSRGPEHARSGYPEGHWVRLDMADARSIEAALDGCDTAFYLVHQLEQVADYPNREARAADRLAAAATRAGLHRLTYLGGVQPRGRVSAHLRSRLDTGRILRERFGRTVELRAAMIIGHGSASFELVRRLAARVPLVVQPDWLLYRSCPVAIDDVVAALAATLLLPQLKPGWYDAPGPECLSHLNVLQRVSQWLGRDLRLLRVPDLPPAWSAFAVALATGTNLHLSRQLMEGLRSDLVPEPGRRIWAHFPEYELRSVDAAIHDALTDQRSPTTPSARTSRRLVRRVAQLARRVGS